MKHTALKILLLHAFLISACTSQATPTREYPGIVLTNCVLSTPGVDLEHYTLRPGGAEAHNLYLGTGAELGVTGLVLYLGMMGSTALMLRRTAKRAFAVGEYFVGRVANALILSLLGWAIASIFISTETTRAFWIVVGLALALPKLVPEQPEEAIAPRSS